MRSGLPVARIVAGVATSHVPAIGAAIDLGKTGDAYWKPVFDGYEWTKKWIAEEKPDVVILVYNDHASAFSLEMIPTFVLGTAPEFQPTDERGNPLGGKQVVKYDGTPEDLGKKMAENRVPI